MYFTSGSDRAFEQLMQARSGADHFDSGVAGAVALRLMVYCKSKNAKKYRRGVEYGSARWFAISTAQKMMWLCRWPLSISGKKTIKNKRLFRGLHKKQNRGCFIHPPFSRQFHSI